MTKPLGKVFVSSERVDDPYVACLIHALRQGGFVVLHSPRNPGDGKDERWESWYATGCQEALDQADLFVIAITAGWDASTWMAHEADEALKQLTTRQIRRMFYYNPARIPIHPGAMKQHYLKQKLPDDIQESIQMLALE